MSSPPLALSRRAAGAAGLLLALAVSLSSSQSLAGNARLLTTEEAAPLEHPVLGLQRSALPLFGGLALDTSMLANLALAPNLGLRWGLAAGPHRFVVGARYTQFVGASVYESLLRSQQALVTRFVPRFSGPSAYAVYGVELGPVLIQAEARYALYEQAQASLTGAVALRFAEGWSLIAEGGTRLLPASALRGAAGLRYSGRNFGLALGAAYVGLEDPLLPGGNFPLLPVFDLSWTFQ